MCENTDHDWNVLFFIFFLSLIISAFISQGRYCVGAEHTWAFNTDYINGGTKSITTLIKAQRVTNNQALKRL